MYLVVMGKDIIKKCATFTDAIEFADNYNYPLQISGWSGIIGEAFVVTEEEWRDLYPEESEANNGECNNNEELEELPF